MTHDRSSSSGEPFDLAILDEELGEVLEVSCHVDAPRFKLTIESNVRSRSRRGKWVRIRREDIPNQYPSREE